jgi:predicted ABC-type ATPase
MAQPRMIVVAGPPGSGKSTRFPLSSLAPDFFNADDRAAELNNGYYRKISKDIRAQVNLEFEKWILDHIVAKTSFAFETTLRSSITFDQARRAREHGFWTSMHFVCAGSVNESVRRVMERSYRGGHSASERLIRDIYDRSTRNLLTALSFAESAIEVLRIYDNSRFDGRMIRAIEMRSGRVVYLASQISPWLEDLLRNTEFNIPRLRAELQSRLRGTSNAQNP